MKGLKERLAENKAVKDADGNIIEPAKGEVELLIEALEDLALHNENSEVNPDLSGPIVAILKAAL